MNRSGVSSGFEIVLACLGKIWEPSAEAFRVQKDLGVNSLKETIPALESAGFEVCSVDLPDKVSGFAEIIAGRPHIILNRQKSDQHLQYTVPHELGHHILHLSPVAKPDPLGFQGVGNGELEADLFATSWLMFLRNDKGRNNVLAQNPESSRILVLYLFFTIALVLCTLIAHLFIPHHLETK
jgi:hypothetical protein